MDAKLEQKALLPCPFCGSAAEDDEFGGYVRCTNITDASGGCFMAIDWVSAKKWNTRALQAQPAEGGVVEVCEWRCGEWDEGDDYWLTGCGQTFHFIEGGPEENGQRYCHSCGKPVFIAAPKPATTTGEGVGS